MLIRLFLPFEASGLCSYIPYTSHGSIRLCGRARTYILSWGDRPRGHGNFKEGAILPGFPFFWLRAACRNRKCTVQKNTKKLSIFCKRSKAFLC